jgi:hypothetical protein
MRHTYACCLLLITWICSITVQAQVFTSAKGKVTFYSTARVENIEATNDKVGVVINTTTNELMVKVSIASFVFKNGLMQEHFNETYMESDTYPTAQFKGNINEKVTYAIVGEYPVTVTGTLIIHGVSVVRTIAGTLKVTSTGLVLISDFMVSVSDHKIKIPNDKISNIAQDIKVSVYAACMPYVKK